MKSEGNLFRFLEAQRDSYERAWSEIRNGKKQTHWMWFVFPQVAGLGYSETSRFYAIKNREEAVAYLGHPTLGKRLIEISSELLKVKSNDVRHIFGSPDDLKLKSSMTLFASIESTDPVFQVVLNKFFDGRKDERTLRIISEKF